MKLFIMHKNALILTFEECFFLFEEEKTTEKLIRSRWREKLREGISEVNINNKGAIVINVMVMYAHVYNKKNSPLLYNNFISFDGSQNLIDFNSGSIHNNRGERRKKKATVAGYGCTHFYWMAICENKNKNI